MRVYNIFIIVLNTLLFLSLGLLLIGTGASKGVADQLVVFHTWMGQAVESSPSARVLAFSAGLICVLISLSTIIGNLRNRRHERAVIFKNPQGEVMVALGALEDLGRLVKAEVPAIKDIKLRVDVRSKGLRVTARVVLWGDASIPDATEQCQDSIRRCFQGVLGLDQDLKPRVLVSKVAYRDPEDRPRDELARARKRYPSSVV